MGVARLGLAGLGVALTTEKLEKCYDDFAQLSARQSLMNWKRDKKS